MKTKDEQIKILPCPFCGSQPEIQRDDLVTIECQKCGQAQVICAEEKDAISDWNRRVTDQPLQCATAADPVAKESLTGDGWIPWAGGECPVHGNTMVDVEFSNGYIGKNCRASTIIWGNAVKYRYRVADGSKA